MLIGVGLAIAGIAAIAISLIILREKRRLYRNKEMRKHIRRIAPETD